jgi:hypothetical protein
MKEDLIENTKGCPFDEPNCSSPDTPDDISVVCICGQSRTSMCDKSCECVRNIRLARVGFIPAECFTNDESKLEDGQYVCKVDRYGKVGYEIYRLYKGMSLKLPDIGNSQITILTFAKLPE